MPHEWPSALARHICQCAARFVLCVPKRVCPFPSVTVEADGSPVSMICRAQYVTVDVCLDRRDGIGRVRVNIKFHLFLIR